MEIKIKEYLTENGKSPFSEWFKKLKGVTASKIVTAIYRLQQGNWSNVKSLGGGLFEYKIDYGPGFRIYFIQEGDVFVVLLAGGSKKTQPKDIQVARKHAADYQSRKRGGNIIWH